MAETLTLTVAERAEIEANRRRYEALKSAGQNNAPKALPGNRRATPRRSRVRRWTKRFRVAAIGL